MEKKIKVHEKFLYEIWKKQNFIKTLNTEEGQQIEIIDTGVQNNELGGPDFMGARIKIGNLTYHGDVEIDTYHSDWKAHGHYLNKKYNSVILHATLNNESRHHFVYTQEGRKVQTISLDAFLDEDIRKHVHNAILSERKNRMSTMPCFEINALVSEKEKLDFICELGIDRFKGKCNKALERLKEITYLNELSLKEPVVKYELDENFYSRNFTYDDFNKPVLWEQLIFESIFEALGYSKNREIMQKLARSINFQLFKKIENKEDFTLIIESMLFNVGGLMPDIHNLPDEETSDYIKKLTEHWSEYKLLYDGEFYNSSQWHFFKLRPQNFPTIRLAGGARLVYRIINAHIIDNMIILFEKFYDLKRIIKELRNFLIVRGDGFWKKHFVFDKISKIEIKYFIGLSRADEIIVNVILPILSVYFDIFDKKPCSEKVKKVYMIYLQQSENHLVDEVTEVLALNDAWKRSVFYQGMIELFRNYCSREKCLECKIGAKIFG